MRELQAYPPVPINRAKSSPVPRRIRGLSHMPFGVSPPVETRLIGTDGTLERKCSMSRPLVVCLAVVCLSPCVHSEETAPGGPVPVATGAPAVPPPVLQSLPTSGPLPNPSELLVSATIAPQLGDSVLLDLSGRPGRAWWNLQYPSDELKESREVGVVLEAKIIEIDKNGFRAEHTAIMDRSTKSPRVVTITVEADNDQLLTMRRFAQREEYPHRLNEMIEHRSRVPTLRIDTFDRASIREWALARTIDD